jgi:hypothetical protein
LPYCPGKQTGAESVAWQGVVWAATPRLCAAGRDYGQAALDGECAKVSAAAVTTRNETLNRAAFKLGQLVASGELDRSDAVTGLLQAASSNGLGGAEAVRTVNSGMTAGARQPRGRSR